MTAPCPTLTRDYFFEFAGMPKSGKSTIAEIVVHYFKRNGYRVSEFHGGGRYAPIDKGARGSLNLAIACRTTEYLLTQYEREMLVPRIFILDRGLFDCCVFTATLAARQTISQSEKAVLQGLLTLPRLAGRVDRVFAFITSPALSLQREEFQKVAPPTLGRVMNESALAALRNATQDVAADKADAFPRITLIDTEKTDGNVTLCAQTVIDLITEAIVR